MKFIKALSEVEVLTLRTAQRDGPTPRMRQRALAVLLSSQGLRITQLVAVLGVDRDTVSVWLDAWEARGLRGLYDGPRTGRPPRLAAADRQWLSAQLCEQPRPLQQVRERLRAARGKVVSVQTLKRALKKKLRLEAGVARADRPTRPDRVCPRPPDADRFGG